MNLKHEPVTGKKFPTSIKVKLAIPSLLIFIFATLIVNLYFPPLIKKIITSAMEDKIKVMSRLYTAPIEQAVNLGRYDTLIKLTSAVKKTPGLSYVFIVDTDKDPLYALPEGAVLTKELQSKLDKEGLFENNGNLTHITILKSEGERIGNLVLGLDLDERDSLIMKNKITIIVSSIIFSLLCIVILYFVSNKLLMPINYVSNGLRDIAEGAGDLTKRLDIRSSDEVGQLSYQFNTFIEKIHHIVAMVKDTTIQVKRSSGEITKAVEEQTAVTAEQSASVSEITTTMEELSATSTQIADHSQAVVDISSHTLGDSEKGSKAVQKLMGKMDDIFKDNKISINEIVTLGNTSKEINKVMEIINNVADQTRLIAFNAAIEASSAGESGKRFGVVAAEIRRLADNVTESTSEIEHKIGEIQEAINRLVISSEKSSTMIKEGMSFTSQTVDILKEILKGAYTTSDAAKQISLSTRQQKTANSQVLSALRGIEIGSQKASNSIKQTGLITSDLEALSLSLKNLVDSFKLKTDKLS